MRKFVLILISLVILFLIAIAIYKSYTPNSEIQKTASVSAEASTISTALAETVPVTVANETANYSSTTTANETSNSSTTTAAGEISNSSTTTAATEAVESTTQEVDINLPTLKLSIYEGPVVVQDSGMAYYRVEARVTGNPAPYIKFSRDDSGGVWGKNRAQINLNNGESYDLVVTAVNSIGAVKKHIVLTWSQ
jgi:septal ring-binding cell division protein DamX